MLIAFSIFASNVIAMKAREINSENDRMINDMYIIDN